MARKDTGCRSRPAESIGSAGTARLPASSGVPGWNQLGDVLRVDLVGRRVSLSPLVAAKTGPARLRLEERQHCRSATAPVRGAAQTRPNILIESITTADSKDSLKNGEAFSIKVEVRQYLSSKIHLRLLPSWPERNMRRLTFLAMCAVAEIFAQTSAPPKPQKT